MSCPAKPEIHHPGLFYIQRRDAEAVVTDDSLPLALPVPRWGASSSEVTTLYRELRKPLLRYVVCLGLSADEAQDVIQDVFVSLQRHLASNGAQDNIRGWLFRVAHNAARRRQTSYHRRFAQPLDSEMEILAAQATPEQALLEKEKFRQLGAAIRQLTVPERECLLLRAEGLRYREIADILEMATSTVADTVDRAIRKLAEKCNV
jgi:RNA polymerase sigma-70 factor, ECF subfamily